MQNLELEFIFHSTNTFITVALIGIIPLGYLLNAARKIGGRVAFDLFFGSFIAMEYLLLGLWFIATFPGWIFLGIAIFLGNNSLLASPVWVQHLAIYLGFLVSLFIIPSWIQNHTESMLEVFKGANEDDR